jgi:hypothetical protein
MRSRLLVILVVGALVFLSREGFANKLPQAFGRWLGARLRGAQGIEPHVEFVAQSAKAATTAGAKTAPANPTASRRAPAEQTEQRLPVTTFPETSLMKLSPPAPASTQVEWREAERLLAQLRTQRKEFGTSYGELRTLYAQLAEPKWSGSNDHRQHLDQLARWQTEFPDSTAPLVVAANANIKFAWEARGSGTANKVTENGWQLFATRIGEAHRLLAKAIQMGAPDGEAYRAMITVAMAESQPRKQTQSWLEAGSKLDPTYFSIYEAMATYLLPRWHGDPGDVEQFVSDLVEMLPGDDGLEAAARVALYVHGYEGIYGETLSFGRYDRELLVRAAETMLYRHPDSERVAQFAALCALAAQDHQAAQRIRPSLARFQADHKVWLWENSFKQFRTWSSTAENPTGEENWVWASQGGLPRVVFGRDSKHVWSPQQFGRIGAALINVKTGYLESSLLHPGGAVNGIAIDHQRDWIAISAWRDKLVGWLLFEGAGSAAPLIHVTAQKCDSLAIQPKKPFVFWTEGTVLRSWNVDTRKPGITIDLPAAARRLAFSPDGSVLAVDINRILLCDPEAGTIKAELAHAGMNPKPPIDAKWLLGVDDAGRVLATALSGQPVKVPVVRFAADGATWETLIPDVRAQNSWLSTSGKLIAVARFPTTGPSGIDVWELESAQMIKHFAGHWNRIADIAFSPDGKKLASVGAAADAIKIWSLTDVASK